MTYKSHISIGKIVITPEKPKLDLESMRYVVTLDPNETLPRTGKIVLSQMYKGTAKEAWHVQYGSYVINCSLLLNLDVDQYNSLEVIDSLPEEKIDELQDAHEWAVKRRELGY